MHCKPDCFFAGARYSMPLMARNHKIVAVSEFDKLTAGEF